jgi:predicted DNA-binding transcriptional regulator AlpA
MLTTEMIEFVELFTDRLAEKIVEKQARPEPWITLKECAEGMGKSIHTLYRVSSRSDFPKLPGNPIRVKKSQVESFFKCQSN